MHDTHLDSLYKHTVHTDVCCLLCCFFVCLFLLYLIDTVRATGKAGAERGEDMHETEPCLNQTLALVLRPWSKQYGLYPMSQLHTYFLSARPTFPTDTDRGPVPAFSSYSQNTHTFFSDTLGISFDSWRFQLSTFRPMLCLWSSLHSGHAVSVIQPTFRPCCVCGPAYFQAMLCLWSSLHSDHAVSVIQPTFRPCCVCGPAYIQAMLCLWGTTYVVTRTTEVERLFKDLAKIPGCPTAFSGALQNASQHAQQNIRHNWTTYMTQRQQQSCPGCPQTDSDRPQTGQLWGFVYFATPFSTTSNVYTMNMWQMSNRDCNMSWLNVVTK